MKRFLTAMTGIVMLWGCDALKPDKTSLWATSAEPVERPRCDACHGFAPRTGAHRFHLDTLRTASRGQTIGCMDCHAASIAYSRTSVVDTTFFQIDGPALHSKGFPWRDFLRPSEIDPNMIEVNLIDSFPLAAGVRETQAENPFWITAEAKGPGLPGHANGKLDVVFAARNDYKDDTGLAYKASWNPLRLSCNAVACHGSHAFDTVKYVWKEPKK